MPMIYQTTGTIWACKTWGEAKTIKLCNQPWWAWYHTPYFNTFTVEGPKHILVGCYYCSSVFFFCLFEQLFPLFKSSLYAPFVQIEHVWEPKSFPQSTFFFKMHFLSLDLMVLFQCSNAAQRDFVYLSSIMLATCDCSTCSCLKNIIFSNNNS